MKVPIASIAFFLLLCIVIFDRQPAQADCRSFSSLIDNGGYAVADSAGQIIMSCNSDMQFIPASVVKIPLALAAFEILGPHFRFSTHFYLDHGNNLYIKGNGDPFLISEEITLIVDKLFDKGVREVQDIFIDNSTYKLSGQVPGGGNSDNPYDVPVSAVAVNFNTVNVRVGIDGKVESAEPQTPTLPLMFELANSLPPGEYRINICQNGCDEQMRSGRYVAELFQAVLREKSIVVKGAFALRSVPPSLSPVYTHLNTKDLQEVVYSFLKYSNNFVANQVFLSCGMQMQGAPATWEKAQNVIIRALEKLLGSEVAGKIVMEDGAGLSRLNRATPIAMLKALEKFRSFTQLLQEKKGVRLKSGTLDGVYNYAGYLADGKAFVILLNQRHNTRDEIMQRLQIEMK